MQTHYRSFILMFSTKNLISRPMKIRLLALLALVYVFDTVSAQTTLYLRPNAASGKDSYNSSFYNTTNFGVNQSLIIADSPTNGTNGSYKALLQFDLTSIPAGSTITSALLSLYNDPTSAFNSGQHSTAGGSNSFRIYRVTQAWSESTVTYSTSPGFTNTNIVTVAASTNNNQDFLNIDVSGHVTAIINNQGSSHGFYFSLTSGVYSPLRCVVLASSDHADSTKRPKLVVTYTGTCTANITTTGSTTFCSGGNVLLTANSGTSYQWKNNGVNITGATSQNYTATASGAYTVVVTSGTCSATSGPITVTVNPVPPATITPAGATTFCSPSSVLLNANTGSGLTYQWKKNNSNISGATSSSYTASTTGNYTVVVTSSGCSATSGITTVTEVLENAGITANGGYTGIACLNGGVTFNATTGAGYTYQWKLNGNNISGATLANYSTSVAGTYTCQITSGSCSVLSNSIAAQLKTSVTNVNGPTVFCTSGATLSTTSNIGSSPTYQWQNNGVNIPGANGWQYTPTTSGNFYCIITDAGFCNAPATSNGINIQAGVPPQIGISSSNGQWPVSICNGQPVNLTLMDASTGTPWMGGSGIQWFKNGNAIVDGTGWGNVLSGIYESGLYNVTLSTSCGTSVIQNPLPVVNIHSAYISAGGASCSPTLSLEPNMVSFAPYQWYLNGNPISGAVYSTHVANVTGNYTCQITNACGTNVIGPEYVASATPNPVITPAGPTTNCGGSVVLNANTGSGWNYWWKKNGVNIPGANGSSYTATTSGTYSVEVGTPNNCYAVSSAVAVLVTAPTVTITAGGNTTFCTGGSVILSATASSGQTYQWRKNGIAISGAVSTTYNATTTGSYTCLVSNSCGSTTSNAISVSALSVPAKPGSISAVGGNTKVCPGTVKTYNIAAVSGASSYTWTPPPGGVVTSGQGTTSATVTYNSGFIANDSLRVTASNMCGTSLHRALSIKRNNPTTPGVISGAYYGLCNATGIPYSVTNVAGMTYNWYLHNGSGNIASGQGTNSITVNYNPGNFTDTLKVTASNACGTSAVRKLTVRAIPVTPASITGATSVCANQQGVPYSISPIASATTYTWVGPTGSHISDGVTTSPGNTLTTSSTSVTVNYAASGGTLKVKANNACGSSGNRSVTITIVCRQANDISIEDFVVTLHPNPASHEFYIHLDNSGNESNELRVRDVEGRVIYEKQFQDAELRIDAAILNPGIYFVEVRNSRGVKVLQLVKTD
jgi:hypothetical protein